MPKMVAFAESERLTKALDLEIAFDGAHDGVGRLASRGKRD